MYTRMCNTNVVFFGQITHAQMGFFTPFFSSPALAIIGKYDYFLNLPNEIIIKTILHFSFESKSIVE